MYEQTVDRWFIAQMALPYFPYAPFYLLVAVSATSDPLGSWYLYAYEFSKLPDYPKFSVWHDAYYLSFNGFSSGSLSWAGVGAAALDRAAMLNGDPNASIVYFDLSPTDDPYSYASI